MNDEGRTFLPTAKRIWDLLLTERIESIGAIAAGNADGCFDRSRNAALTQGERIFTELVEEHRARIQEERERAEFAYETRHQAIGRVGLQTVRDFRRKRLRADHDARIAQLDAAEAYTPDLNAILMLRVGEMGSGTS